MTATNHRTSGTIQEIPYIPSKLTIESDDEPEFLEDQRTVPGRFLWILGLIARDWASDIEVTSKTRKISRMVYGAGEERHATLRDFTISATKGEDPTSHAPFMYIAMSYFITSHGVHTKSGLYLPGPMLARLHFMKNDNGIVYELNVPYGISVDCAHNDTFVSVSHREQYYLSWFDHWKKTSWTGYGQVYDC